MEPIDAPDWVDQDLLTRSDAAERLDAEIADDRERLAGLEAAHAQQSALTLVQRRIDAMSEMAAELRADTD
ncbi:hypothetical protein [Williamsia sp. DF01-3]|uniref:hypothetical protein n=1 Tax=Williamsia sp. DF01-3 TaxID=2934157 RepID=UPI001FF4A528|nr:hypothetical protein [Williamsia sp. DF01-3]MCK0517348.1 hypothetical protein [Williamsia sp. DF01-3]